VFFGCLGGGRGRSVWVVGGSLWWCLLRVFVRGLGWFYFGGARAGWGFRRFFGLRPFACAGALSVCPLFGPCGRCLCGVWILMVFFVLWATHLHAGGAPRGRLVRAFSVLTVRFSFESPLPFFFLPFFLYLSTFKIGTCSPGLICC